jgi:DNA-binding response OmpR family regulator
MDGPILVVEDSLPIRRLIEICLRRVGPAVVTAADGSSALAVAHADPPSLVVLDLGLPAVEGRELLAGLRAHPVLDSAPVLLLTAHSGEPSQFEPWIEGVDAHMTKPFDPADLVATARRLLRSRRRSRPPVPVGASDTARE